MTSGAGAGGEVAGAAAPALVEVRLSRYRNYAGLTLSLEPRAVVLTGPNGAGKTNLLEAVSFLAPGRGLRRAALSEVTHRPGGPSAEAAGPDAASRDAASPDGAGWAVSVRLRQADGSLVAIGTGLEDGSARRTLRIDRRAERSQSALADRLAVLWLTPAMDRLFVDRAAERRRFLDRLVFTLAPAHADQTVAYEGAMRERLRLLRRAAETGRPADPAWLDVLEARMAEAAVAVAAARREWLARLSAAMAEASRRTVFPPAGLALDGRLETALETAPAIAVEEDFRGRLAGTRGTDAAAGTTTEGPHRSDLKVWHQAKGIAAAQCSTGEQKALLIGLVLAQARLLAGLTGRAPLLLLDEVAAHLDAARRGALFALLGTLGGQAWLTGTDAALFADYAGEAQFFRVEDGRIGDNRSV